MANFNFNKCILGGRLCAAPELKHTQSGVAVATFTIAVNRKYSREGEPKTEFINIVAWRELAEHVCKFFSKGSSICIVGNIQNRTWEDKGIKRTATEVVATEVNFVDSKSEAAVKTTGDAPAQSSGEQMQEAAIPHSFDELTNDDDLPF